MSKDVWTKSITHGGKFALDLTAALVSLLPAVIWLRRGDELGWAWVAIAVIWASTALRSYVDWRHSRKDANRAEDHSDDDQVSAQPQ